MRIKFDLLIRLFATVFIFVVIDLFGFANFYEDRLFVFANTFDIFIVALNALFLFFLSSSSKFRHSAFRKPLKYITIIYCVVLLTFISMPFRGQISLIDAIRVGRHYLILPLSILIYYDVKLNSNFSYYLKIIKFIAFFSALQIMINVVSPEIINSVFSNIGRAVQKAQGDYHRNLLISKSMIFPHILTIYYYYKILTGKLKANNFIGLAFLLTASSLQGYRVYLIVLVLVLILVTVKYGEVYRKVFKWLLVLLIAIPIVVILDKYFVNNQILGKFYSAYEEVVTGSGSYQTRLDRVNVKQVLLIYENPLFGLGFIYHDSPYGRSLGLRSDGADAHIYGLYSVDAGYITLLMQFGFVGVLIILLCLFGLFISLYKNVYHNPKVFVTCMGIIVILILSIYTHGAFTREFGLLPFSMMLGLAVYKERSI